MKDKDKELLLEAIDNYDAYTLKQREILKILVGISVNDVAVITPRKLTGLLKTTRATIYYGLARLKKDGVIISKDENKERFNTFRLNNTKLEDIITSYKKMEFLIKNT
jgi:hypothetical protein